MQINTNSMALFAHRTLNSQQQHLGKAMERLSSGLRINNAADDVAGVAISDRMTARIRSLNQVHRNANDGISLLQTADSALGNIGDMLQRIRELGVQSANDTNNGTDRGSMQREVNQLLQEISRISVDTKFNGKSLMDGIGSMGSADANQQAVIDGLRGAWLRESETLIQDYYGLTADGASLKIVLDTTPDPFYAAYVSSTGSDSSGKLLGLELHIDMADFTPPNPPNGGTAPFYNDRIIAHEMVHAVMGRTMNFAAINSTALWFQEGTAEFIHGADERVVNDLTTAGSVNAFVNAVGGASSSLEYASAYVAVRYLHEHATGGIKGIMTQLKNGADLDSAIAATTGYANASAFLTDYKSASGGQAYLQSLIDGGYLSNEDTGAIGGADADGGAIRTAESVIPDTGGYTLDPLSGFVEEWPSGFDNTGVSRNSFRLQVGENAGSMLNVSIGATTVAALDLSGIDVAVDPNTVIDKIDLALTYLDEQRGEVGAAINRLGHLINVNAINIETTSDARSRILDADYGQETSELVRRQILQQASQSMLAQANAAPQQVLRLLSA